MGTENKSSDETVTCEVCLKEIEASESLSEEAEDYVINFCGLECYNKWKDKQAHN